MRFGNLLFLILILSVGLSTFSCTSPTAPTHLWSFTISGTQKVLVNVDWVQHGQHYDLTQESQNGTLWDQMYLPGGLDDKYVAEGWTEKLTATYADQFHTNDTITINFYEDDNLVGSVTGKGSATLSGTM